MAAAPLTADERRYAVKRTLDLADPGEVPFLIEIGPFHAATKEYYESDQAELAWNLGYERDRRPVYDYGISNIKPNLGIGFMAAAFGCQVTANAEADPWIKAMLREENASQVYDLELPDLETNALYRRAFDRIERLQGGSTLPLRLVNVASPLVTASQIWDYTSFIEATLLYPKEVHELLEKVTEATIAFVREQRRRIRRLHALSHEMWYLPEDYGIRVSDDTAALMSPDLYREFGVRYNNRLSEAFGGIVVHSCGDLQNVVAVMMETKGLRGLDITMPNNPRWDVLKEAAAGKTALNLRHFYWDHGSGVTVDAVEYTRKLLEVFGRRGILIQTSTPDAPGRWPSASGCTRRCGSRVQAAYDVGPRHAGLRADIFLALMAPFLSRGRIKRLIQSGEALVDGHRLASSTRLRAGNSLVVRWRDDDDRTPSAAGSLVVLYEDERLLALDKPAGMPVHPVGRKQSGSLVQAVRERYAAEIAAALARGDGSFYPGLAHRLDLFTSGVVLVAKDRPALVALQRAVAEGRFDKRYLAIVEGEVAGERGTIDAPIGAAEGSAVGIRRAVRPDGLPAVTDWEVRERLRGHTLLAVRPRTGRQHQIRVHLASIGHPVWGDLVYRDERLFLRYVANGCRLDATLPPRQALHAEALRFRHPGSGALVEISAPVPEDFERILESLR